MRILIVMHDFSGGGTEHVAIKLATEWARAKRDVVIFCGTEIGVLRPIVPPGVRVVRAGRECRRSPLSRLFLARELALFAARERPDVVFAPGNFHIPVVACFRLVDRSGATIVVKLSNPTDRRSPDRTKTLFNWGFRTLTRRLDCLVAMSPALRDHEARALNRSDIDWAWEPILTAGAPAPGDRSKTLFFAIGRLEKQKNFELALQAMALADPTARLLIFGEGSERAALTRTILQLGLSRRVRLCGYRPEVGHHLRHAAALLLPSAYEGYPAVAVEAIAAGVPVFATDCSVAMAEILGGDARNRILPSRPEAFAAAMNASMAGSGISAEAMQSQDRHCVETAGRAYLDLLDRARGRQRRTR